MDFLGILGSAMEGGGKAAYNWSVSEQAEERKVAEEKRREEVMRLREERLERARENAQIRAEDRRKALLIESLDPNSAIGKATLDAEQRQYETAAKRRQAEADEQRRLNNDPNRIREDGDAAEQRWRSNPQTLPRGAMVRLPSGETVNNDNPEYGSRGAKVDPETKRLQDSHQKTIDRVTREMNQIRGREEKLIESIAKAEESGDKEGATRFQAQLQAIGRERKTLREEVQRSQIRADPATARSEIIDEIVVRSTSREQVNTRLKELRRVAPREFVQEVFEGLTKDRGFMTKLLEEVEGEKERDAQGAARSMGLIEDSMTPAERRTPRDERSATGRFDPTARAQDEAMQRAATIAAREAREREFDRRPPGGATSVAGVDRPPAGTVQALGAANSAGEIDLVAPAPVAPVTVGAPTTNPLIDDAEVDDTPQISAPDRANPSKGIPAVKQTVRTRNGEVGPQTDAGRTLLAEATALTPEAIQDMTPREAAAALERLGPLLPPILLTELEARAGQRS
jgi:hypothetical protein